MEVIFILGAILLAVVVVLARLFLALRKLSSDVSEIDAVPVKDLKGTKPLAVTEPVHQMGAAVNVPPGGPSQLAVSVQDNGLLVELERAREKMAALVKDFDDVTGILRTQNEGLRREIEQLRQINARLQEEELPHLKAENSAYKTQLETGQAEFARLAHGISQFEVENAQLKADLSLSVVTEKTTRDVPGELQGELLVRNNHIADLKRQNEMIRSELESHIQKASTSPQLNTQAIEALQEDIEVLRQDRSRFKGIVEELEEGLRGAGEKNSFLQYELTKSRAHSVGMERLCDNARRQFEGLAMDVHDSEKDNVQLKQQSNVLEQGLMDFKRLNSELLKRERLTQYELESNRTQLRDLEHIYQVFRSRLQSAGIGENNQESVSPAGILDPVLSTEGKAEAPAFK